jgi:FixJ family two-component response regulator
MMRIPVIVITGAHMSRASAEILQNFSIPALRKPWKETDLLDSIEEAFLGTAAFSKRDIGDGDNLIESGEADA